MDKSFILILGIISITYLLVTGNFIDTIKYGNSAVSQKLKELEYRIECLERIDE